MAVLQEKSDVSASAEHSIGSAESRKITVIEPKSGWVNLDAADVWAYRDLLITFAQRDVKLRYRQTSIGVLWVIIQPLLATGVFSIIFGVLGKNSFPTYDLPPFIFIFAGQLGWTAFNSTVTKANMSLVTNANLVSKIYFPRLVLPLSTVLSTLIDFGIALGLMLVLMAVFHIVPTGAIFLLPFFIFLALVLAVGIGLFTAALTVSYRDVQYAIPFFMNLLMYATPVNYALPDKVNGAVRFFFSVNPLTPLIEGVRWSLLGVSPPPAFGAVAYATFVSIFALVGGAYSFRKMERKFADVI